MTTLARVLGLADRELISLVGGGGKTTMMFRLGTELAAAGRRVLLTTTTKMGQDQAIEAPTICTSTDIEAVAAALAEPGPLMAVAGGDGHKVTGPSPELIDYWYTSSGADYIIVEADGSRSLPLKAPAAHEPVVPSATTTVVILMGIDAVGSRIDRAVHRVDEAVRFTGLSPDHVLTAADCAAIITHPEGALRVCPPHSRVLVAVTRVASATDEGAAAEVAARLASARRIAATVVIGSLE